MIESFTKDELVAVIVYHMNILNLYIKEEKGLAFNVFAEDLPPFPVEPGKKIVKCFNAFARDLLKVPLESGEKIVECLKALDRMNNDSV